MTAAAHFSLGRALSVWLGQVLSLFGSSLTSFALGVWMYQTTGGVTRFALIMLCAALPGVLLGPVTGALVDRWPLRRGLLLSDTVAGLMTMVLALLLLTGQLRPWHAYVTTAIVSMASAFQQPAFAVLVSTVVPPQHLGRANGLIQLGLACAQLGAPLASAALLAVVGLEGILLLDAGTFLLGVLPLFLLRIPERPASTSVEGPPSLLSLVREGGAYLRGTPGLLALFLFLAGSNFITGVVEVLVTPLVLALADVKALGMLTTAGGVGLLVGSVVMSAWGGPRRQVHGVLLFQLTCGLSLVVVGFGTSLPLLAAVSFAFFFGIPLINGASQSLLQRIVPLALRGRVFAFSSAITGMMLPLAYSLSGPLADLVFEPALRPGGSLVPLLGTLIGTGAGRGIALMFLLAGTLTVLLTGLAALHRPLRALDARPEASPGPSASEPPIPTSSEGALP
ncbi:major facilitator family transporter [Myxococcus stipitatus DSM 14675]|uniref:Major facilitator family transporter n=1 Tax=Myxococcus stipitatus (strain DSM 14675 / JCM 12634 / Mx s8) TaxID=1278073 RepID=L7U759_MYXSD|nr:MFS transporter [Myxococcus stipitatus]AGC43402.1 major facilitator family transporter [Myxococcus stipitatus DSM 14675]